MQKSQKEHDWNYAKICHKLLQYYLKSENVANYFLWIFHPIIGQSRNLCWLEPQSHLPSSEKGNEGALLWPLVSLVGIN